jgi:hypothetical protein
MFYDVVNNSDHRAKLDGKIRDFVIEAQTSHRQMWTEWADADKYFESDQVPAGFTDDHKQSLVDVNDPTKGNMTSKQYVVLNKVVMSHEKTLGDFLTGKRMLLVSGRTPRDRRFAKAIQKKLDYVSDSVKLWDEIMVPTLDCGIRRGLHWVKVWFDPYKDLPHGRIMMQDISCRDILIDPRCRRYYYQDKRYVIHRQRFTVDGANMRFRPFLRDNATFAADRKSDEPYNTQTSDFRQQHCTVDEVQYTETEVIYYAVNPDGAKDKPFVEIDEQTYLKALDNEKTRALVFQSTEDVWYVCYYNESIGVFYNAPIEYMSDTIIPFINIRSEGRVYPFGSTKYEKNLQDLLNVFVSVMLDNAKKGNSGIYSVSPATYQQFGDQLIAAINGTGPRLVPDENFKVHYPREINPALVQLYGMVQGAIDEVQSSHALSRGEMPRERLATATVNMLISRDRVSHGRKDVMVRWTMTKISQILYKIISKKSTEEDWVKVTDENKADPEYVPINFTVNDQEYNQLMLEMLGIQITPEMEQNQQFMMELQQKVKEARYRFEMDNEVKRHELVQYKVNGQILTPEQLKGAIEQSGMTPEQFQQEVAVEEIPTVIFDINDMTQDADLDLVYDVDFNADRDKELRANRALQLAGMGKLTTKRLLIDLDYPDADSVAMEADQMNQVLQMGNTVMENPDLYALVQQALAVLQTGGSIKPEEKKKEGAK